MFKKIYTENVSASRFIIIAVVAAVWIIYSIFSWKSAVKLQGEFQSTEYRDYCPAGLVETAETIQAQRVATVFGPQADYWPYAFQRLSEMLYPIIYQQPLNADKLCSGDIYVLFAGQPLPVPSVVLLDIDQFRVMEVSP